MEGTPSELEEDVTERISPNEVSGKSFHLHPESGVSEAEKLFPNKDKKVCSFTLFKSCNLLKMKIYITPRENNFDFWKLFSSVP